MERLASIISPAVPPGVGLPPDALKQAQSLWAYLDELAEKDPQVRRCLAWQGARLQVHSALTHCALLSFFATRRRTALFWTSRLQRRASVTCRRSVSG